MSVRELTGRPSVVAAGEHLHLRRLRTRDRRAVLAVTSASRGLHRPWVWPPTSEGSFRGWLREARSARCERLLLRSNESDEIIGYFALNEIVGGSFKSAYLGYWVAAAQEGKGHMKTGMRLLLRHAFTGLRLHRVEANIQPDNLASLALAKSAGFILEGFSPRYLKVGGRWRDHERWALTLEDWRKSKQTTSS